jgi:hypothetical protein
MITWPTRDRTTLIMDANLSDSVAKPVRPLAGDILFSTTGTSATAAELAAWEVRLLLGKS